MRKGSSSIRLFLSLASLAVLFTGCPSQPPGASSSPQPVVASTPATAATPLAQATATGIASPAASPVASASAATPAAVAAGPLTPLPGKTPPPITEIKRFKVTTTVGDFVMEVYPQAAPHAAERFETLVKEGFYDNIAVSRVIREPEPFMAQFGINPAKADWKEKLFDDDVSHYQLLPATVCFAKAGANHNSTQIFINYVDNSHLAAPTPDLNFAVFGKVVEGMDTVGKFAQVGDPGGGLDQTLLWTDPKYLDTLTDKPTMIKTIKAI